MQREGKNPTFNAKRGKEPYILWEEGKSTQFCERKGKQPYILWKERERALSSIKKEPYILRKEFSALAFSRG